MNRAEKSRNFKGLNHAFSMSFFLQKYLIQMKEKKLTKKEKSVLNKADFAATKRKKVAKEIVKVTREVESNLKRLTQAEILDLNADEVIEMIRQAKSYEEIQERFGVHEKYVARFISESEHSARAREAQRESAETISRKAELSLLRIQADDTQATVTRQRELAQHYRWLAAKKNPARFGDSTKIQAEVKDTSTTSAWLSEVLSNIDNNK